MDALRIPSTPSLLGIQIGFQPNSLVRLQTGLTQCFGPSPSPARSRRNRPLSKIHSTKKTVLSPASPSPQPDLFQPSSLQSTERRVKLTELLNKFPAETLIGYKVYNATKINTRAPTVRHPRGRPSAKEKETRERENSSAPPQPEISLEYVGVVQSIVVFNTEGYADETPTFLRVVREPQPSDLLQLENSVETVAEALFPTAKPTALTPIPPQLQEDGLGFNDEEEGEVEELDVLQMVHLVPLVPTIVTSVSTAQQDVHVEAPEGLFDIGRRRLMLRQLDRALDPYKGTPNSLAAVQLGERTMPRQSDLLAAGRRDLVRAIVDAGGFNAVALELGLRARRRPPGYWENEDTLGQEIAMFVAANWVQLDDPDSDNKQYWYNMVTGRTRDTEPVPPRKIPVDDEGSFIFVEDDEDRAMPSASAVRAAGRYDLHQAILSHGGYRATAEMLDRRPPRPRNPELSEARVLRSELRKIAKECGLSKGTMPSVKELLDLGRSDVLREVLRRGGLSQAAAKLGFKSRRIRNRWDLETTARSLWDFIQDTQRPFGADPVPCPLDVPGLTKTVVLDGTEAQEVVDRPSKEAPVFRMPTFGELDEMRRADLRGAVKKHGYMRVAKMLGVQVNKFRNAPKFD